MRETHQGISKRALKARKEHAEVVQSARLHDVEKRKLFFCSDDLKWQNEIGNNFMDWADMDTSLDLDSFPLSRRYSPSRFYRMRDNNPYFAECLEYARAKIGERISAKLQERPDYQMKMLPMYSTLWIEAEERKTAETNKFVHEYKIVEVEIPAIGKSE
jgi:hypothetical protein